MKLDRFHGDGLLYFRWLQAEVAYVTTRSRCAYYTSLLRKTIWPSDDAGSRSSPNRRCGLANHRLEPSERQNIARERARTALCQFFPGKCRSETNVVDFR